MSQERIIKDWPEIQTLQNSKNPNDRVMAVNHAQLHLEKFLEDEGIPLVAGKLKPTLLLLVDRGVITEATELVRLQRTVETRNNIIHRGIEPSSEQASEMVSAFKVFLFRRNGMYKTEEHTPSSASSVKRGLTLDSDDSVLSVQCPEKGPCVFIQQNGNLKYYALLGEPFSSDYVINAHLFVRNLDGINPKNWTEYFPEGKYLIADFIFNRGIGTTWIVPAHCYPDGLAGNGWDNYLYKVDYVDSNKTKGTHIAIDNEIVREKTPLKKGTHTMKIYRGVFSVELIISILGF